MLNILLNSPFYLQMILWVIASLLVAYVIMEVTHRIVRFEVRQKHSEEAGFIFAVVGIFSGLVIAAILVLAIDHYTKTKDAVEHEANMIENVIRAARSTSPELSASVNEAMMIYLKAVSKLEWDQVHRVQNLAVEREGINKVSLAIAQFEPKTAREIGYQQLLFSGLTNLHSARRERSYSADRVVSSEIWVATVLVGVFTILFSFLFGHENRKLHFLMGGLLAGSMGVVYSLILVFDTPYQGDVVVSNEPYLLVMDHLEKNQAWFKENKLHQAK